MNMKTIFKYILAAAMTLSFAACQEEPYSPGEPDLMDCQGLFFPQEQAKAYEVAPEGAKYLTFTVERNPAVKNYFPEAYVPYELISSEEGFFELEDEFIYFDEDQENTSFKVYFSEDFETGKKYTCTIKVTDPQYVSNYGLSSNELTFSLTIVQWNLLGEGLWRDDFASSYFVAIGAEIAAPYQEKKVKVYEREDLPRYYRVDDVYTPDYVSYIVDGNTKNADLYAKYCDAKSVYIDASDVNKVYIPLQYAFSCPSGQYGLVYMGSDVEEVFDAGYSNQYGKLKDGSITFPKNSLVAYLPSAGAAYANAAGKHRLVLPGYQPYDYSVEVEYKDAVKGVMPVTFTLGPDVAKVNYQVFPGHVSDAEMVSKLEEVKSGMNVKTVTESGEYNFTTDKTGLYTLIACSYDAAGNFKEYTYIKFGYDTADDPKEVDIHLGLIVSDKYAGAGLTKENSMEFYLYGSELTNVKVAMYKKAHYEDFREAIEAEFDYYIAPLDRETLAQVNAGGFSGVINNLSAGTEYILLAYAENGYHSGVFTTTEFTAGEFDLMDSEFGIYDLPNKFQPEDKSAYFKEWDVWSLDPYQAKAWGREKRAHAVFSDDKDVLLDENGKVTENPDKAETTIDYVKLSGMYPNAAQKYGFKDEIQLEFYEGFVYTIMTQMEPGEYNGKPVYPTNAYLFFDGSDLTAFLENGAMIGGFLTEEQDVIGFVGNPRTEAGSYGYTYVAMMLCYFNSADYSGEAPLITEDAHAYPLLVSPDSKYADYGADASSLKAPAACNKVSAELGKPRTNYVETDRGYIRSVIDGIKGTPYNYMQNTFNVSDLFFEIEPVSFTMTKSN